MIYDPFVSIITLTKKPANKKPTHEQNKALYQQHTQTQQSSLASSMFGGNLLLTLISAPRVILWIKTHLHKLFFLC